MSRPKGSKNKVKRTNLWKVNAKIKRRIIADVREMFKDSGGLSKMDEKIIRENYEFKTREWNTLGAGMRSVIERVISPCIIHAHAGELQEAIIKDVEAKENEGK